MANYSIPNSTPAIGRISTPLSRQSRKQNNVTACSSPPSSLADAIGSRTLGFFDTQRSTPNAQRPIQTVRRWMLRVERWAFSFWRVKGAWWSSRSSKPLSVPRTGTEVGSIPILSALVNCGLALTDCGLLNVTITQADNPQFAGRSPQSKKGGD